MLKKIVIPICIALLSTAVEAANIYSKDGTSLDVFGKISAIGANSHAAKVIDRKSAAGSSNTLLSYVRFGIAGRSPINEQVDAIALTDFEYYAGPEDNEKLTRYAYVGIDAKQYGILTFGRGDSAYYTVAGATDIYNHLDSMANEYYAFGDQTSGQIMYSLSSMGWDLRMSYQTHEFDLNNTFCVDNSYAFAISTRLASDVSISYGYAYYDLSYSNENLRSANPADHKMYTHFKSMLSSMYHTDNNEFLLGKKPGHREDYGIAVAWGTLGKGLYAAIVFNSTRYQHFTRHIYTYEAAINYTFENGLSLTAGYSKQRYGSTALIEDLHLGVAWKVNPSFKLFIESQIDLGATPEKMYGNDWINRYSLGENKYILGAELAF